MTDAPKPGSPEEAESRRTTGKGPFSVFPNVHQLQDSGNSPVVVTIVDGGGQPFAFVRQNDCAGGDPTAAKARATRIAEALNRCER
jgi:hypothetical protein